MQTAPRIKLCLPDKGLPNRNTHQGVDDFLRTEYRVDTYHVQNLEFLDRSYDFDEFHDIDDEYEGMTIVEPESVRDTIRFLKGYNL
jgi:hypothetical protein